MKLQKNEYNRITFIDIAWKTNYCFVKEVWHFDIKQ